MRTKQQDLNLYKGKWGGRRPGTGRKRIHSKGVAHRTRELVNLKTPLHINFRFKSIIKNKQNLKLLKRAIMNSRKMGLRIVHFSMQSNHVHFIIEASSNEMLTKGMRSLTVTFAKGLKKGKIQVERYHLHVLRSVRETRNAVHYVLFNKQKHEKGTYSVLDEYSSLLSLNEGRKLISKYAQNFGITLQVKNIERWTGDNPRSFILKKSLEL